MKEGCITINSIKKTIQIIDNDITYHKEKLEIAEALNDNNQVNYHKGAISALKGVRTELGYPEQRLI